MFFSSTSTAKKFRCIRNRREGKTNRHEFSLMNRFMQTKKKLFSPLSQIFELFFWYFSSFPSVNYIHSHSREVKNPQKVCLKSIERVKKKTFVWPRSERKVSHPRSWVYNSKSHHAEIGEYRITSFGGDADRSAQWNILHLTERINCTEFAFFAMMTDLRFVARLSTRLSSASNVNIGVDRLFFHSFIIYCDVEPNTLSVHKLILPKEIRTCT